MAGLGLQPSAMFRLVGAAWTGSPAIVEQAIVEQQCSGTGDSSETSTRIPMPEHGYVRR